MGRETNNRIIHLKDFLPDSRTTKFFRIKRDIVVFRTSIGNPSHNQLTVNHDQLIPHVRRRTPHQLDAGCLQFLPGTIRVFDVSDTLGFPLPAHAQEARTITAKILREIFPNYDVHYTGHEPIRGRIMQGDSGEAYYAYVDS